MVLAVNAPLTMLTVVSAVVLLFSCFWWLQTVMAERGDRANPNHPGGDEHLRELETEERAATTTIKVMAEISAALFVIFLIAAIVFA